MTLTSGKVLYGEVFLCVEQRVLDNLDGEEQFLPFEGMDGAMSVINEASVAQITEPQTAAAADRKRVAFAM